MHAGPARQSRLARSSASLLRDNSKNTPQPICGIKLTSAVERIKFSQSTVPTRTTNTNATFIATMSYKQGIVDAITELKDRTVR